MSETVITFDGTDIDKDGPWVAVSSINIWEQYNPRGKVVGLALHGTQGTLLEHKGRRCKVRYGDVEGYVTDWFIKELKQDWLKGRAKEAGVDHD